MYELSFTHSHSVTYRSLHFSRHSPGEQYFHCHRAQWANHYPVYCPGWRERSINDHRTEWPDEHAKREPFRGVNQRNLDWPQLSKRNPQHDVWRREFTNNIHRSRWRRRYSERLRTGHWYGYRDYGWTAWCDRHQSAHALNEDWQKNKASPRINSEARPAIV
jgi:hypothetical protein